MAELYGARVPAAKKGSYPVRLAREARQCDWRGMGCAPRRGQSSPEELAD